MPKSNYEKIVALFEKEDVGNKIVTFDKLREVLENALQDKREELADKMNQFQAIHESIKKQ